MEEEIVTEQAVESAETNEDQPIIEEYRGSKEVNPEQRPLKIVNREQYTDQQIDGFLSTNKDHFIMNDDEFADYEKKIDEKENKEGSIEKSLEKPPEKTETTPEEKPAEQITDDDEKLRNQFFDDTGLTEEVFNTLDEKTQKFVTEKYNDTEVSSIKTNYEKLQTEHNGYKKNIEGLLKDYYLGARAAELEKGEVYIVKSIPELTESEHERYDDAETLEEKNKVINDIVQKKLEPMAKNYFNEQARKEYTNKIQEKSWGIFREIGKIDKSLSFEGIDVTKIQPGHPDWDRWQNGFGKVHEYLKKNGENYETISKKTARGIIAAYNADMGLDKKRDQKIAKTVENKILKLLKNPKKASDAKSRIAATSKRGGAHKRAHRTVSLTGPGQSELLDQIKSGDFTGHKALSIKFAGDPEKTALLGQLFQKGIRLRNQ